MGTVGFGTPAHIGNGSSLREEGDDVILGRAIWQILDVHRLAVIFDHVRPTQAGRCMPPLAALTLLPPPRLHTRTTGLAISPCLLRDTCC